MHDPGRSHAERVTAHGAVSTSLALRSDRELAALLDAATPLGAGIGGPTSLIEVDGTPVFVKRLPLTDLELRPGHVRSTANVFGVPVACQFGVGLIGSPGFGAWRELAVSVMTTNWVLAAQYEGFPLMYHWRVLPGSAPLPGELADVDRAVEYWHGSPQLRERIGALEKSTAGVVLFLEYIPQNVHRWLDGQVAAGGRTAEQACALVEEELGAGLAFMNGRGLLHCDAHFENVLTDGRRLYFADYGLALSSRFTLSPQEADFFARHQVYDRAYVATYLVNWLVTAACGLDRADRGGRFALVRACADGKRLTGVPEGIADVVARHAPVAAVVGDFHRTFQNESRHTPYPLDELALMGTAFDRAGG